METTTTTTNNDSGRRAAVGALAIVGFIALIIIGIGLAIYTARYLPDLPNKLGGGAVSLSSIFHHQDDNTNLQVMTATSTLPFDETSTTTLATSLTSTSTITASAPAQPAPAPQPVTHSAPPVVGYITVKTTTTTTVAPYGNPDLSVVITQVGYLETPGDTGSFVGSNDVPRGKDGAVRFTVKNIGTNVTGEWKFEAYLPTSSGNTSFMSPYQASLNPGDSADFVLGYTHTDSYEQREITVQVDPHNQIIESNKYNNEATATVNLD